MRTLQSFVSQLMARVRKPATPNIPNKRRVGTLAALFAALSVVIVPASGCYATARPAYGLRGGAYYGGSYGYAPPVVAHRHDHWRRDRYDYPRRSYYNAPRAYPRYVPRHEEHRHHDHDRRSRDRDRHDHHDRHRH